MTAERWWVKLSARWLARIDGVSGQIRLAMLILTGISTATLTLRSYGHGELAWPLIAVTAVGGVVFAYYYTEGGVWNQVDRDRKDLSANYSKPSQRVSGEMNAVAMFVAFNGRLPTDDEWEMLETAVDRTWRSYRDGVPLDSENWKPEAKAR